MGASVPRSSPGTKSVRRSKPRDPKGKEATGECGPRCRGKKVAVKAGQGVGVVDKSRHAPNHVMEGHGCKSRCEAGCGLKAQGRKVRTKTPRRRHGEEQKKPSTWSARSLTWQQHSSRASRETRRGRKLIPPGWHTWMEGTKVQTQETEGPLRGLPRKSRPTSIEAKGEVREPVAGTEPMEHVPKP
jgi:hypothetical protein